MKNNLPQKKNHATGYLNYHKMNDLNFNEQFYTYNAYGFAQDPTDFTSNKVVGDIEKYLSDISKSLFEGSTNLEKDYRKKLKLKRMKYCDPSSGEFMGPWAIYDGEEIFKT
jgi:hypothetical protein